MLFKSLLLTTLLLPQPSNAARSIAARRARAASSPDRYDRSITTFSPEGRLLQLEYALIAAEERGWGLTVCVEWEGNVIFAFPSAYSGDSFDLSNTESCEDGDVSDRMPVSNPLHNTKLHRISPTHLLLTSGLGGDSRTLASACRRFISSWTHIQFGETIPVREVAREVGSIRHGLGLRPGARVLGVVGVLIGLDDVHYQDGVHAEVRMYKSLPGGTIDRCNIICTGGGADSVGRCARNDTMEALSRFLSSDTSPDEKYTLGSKDNGKRLSEDVAEGNQLEGIIEAVGKAALQHHPYAISSYEDGDSDTNAEKLKKKEATVDIWVIKASQEKQTTYCNNTINSSPRELCDSMTQDKRQISIGQPFISRNRCLGNSSINVQYASAVSLRELHEVVKRLS